MNSLVNIKYSIAGLLTILIIGIAGYRILERWSMIDSLYMTAITLSTVGFSEAHPLSPQGKIFTVFLIASGIGLAAYAAGSIASFVMEGQFTNLLGRQKMHNRISKIKNHHIICGYGKLSQQIITEFEEKGIPFVVIEKNPSISSKLIEKGTLCIEGDPTTDPVLINAGIERANCIMCALPQDPDNVFVSLSAKGLNSSIVVIAKCDSDETVPKLKKAGADHVISPSVIGGRRMAAAALRPSVVDFLDVLVQGSGGQELGLEELTVPAKSPLAGVALKDSQVRNKTGAIIIGIRRSGKLTANPAPDFKMHAGDTLIVLGSQEGLETLAELLSIRA